jgi:hypothetical protein
MSSSSASPSRKPLPKLEQTLNPSVRQKETGSPFDKSRSKSPVIDQPSKPIIAVAPAFRLHVPAEQPWHSAQSREQAAAARAAPPQLRSFLRSRSGLGGTIGSASGSLPSLAKFAAASGRSLPGLSQLASTAAAAAAGASRQAPAPGQQLRGSASYGVWGPGPAPAQPFRVRHNPANSELRFAFERGDLPCVIFHGAKNRLQWKVPLEKLDYSYYLPLFASGLREVEFPYCFIAQAGFADLLAGAPEQRIVPVVPQLILPLRNAINTRVPDVIVRTMAAILALASVGSSSSSSSSAEAAGSAPSGASSTAIGRALLPYYRQLLPTMNLYASKNLNLGDGIDYGQRFQRSMGEKVAEVLAKLDSTGGEAAYLNILYSVPSYQRAVR